MTIVVDASVALKWVLSEVGSDAAIALQSSSNLIAPDIWLAEAANTLWRYVLRKEFQYSEAEARLMKLRNAPVTTVENDVQAALKIASQLSHPIYDCLYLALAVRQDTYVVTADRRFVAACAKDRSLKQRVRLLGGV
jgi:predicted nucleic acid-binding protein